MSSSLPKRGRRPSDAAKTLPVLGGGWGGGGEGGDFR